MMNFLEKRFQLKANKTDLRTEFRAGLATFLAMAYIIVVNPQILSKAGMPLAGVMFATVLVSSVSSILMGLYANLPFALAPGMGINAFVAFNICLKMNVPWQTAMGVVFVSGIIFIILSITRARVAIVNAIPKELRYGVASGIGLFLAFIGLKNANIVVASPATLVTMGSFNLNFILFIFGLMFTGFLLIKRVKGALIFGIIATSIITLACSLMGVHLKWMSGPITLIPRAIVSLPSLEVFFKMDIVGVFTMSMIVPVFTLLFTDMFDSISTFIGVSEVGNMLDREGNPKNVGKALMVDAISTTFSGLCGTSSGTTYIESAAGVEEGGRTGLTAVFTGLFFIPFMFLSPLLKFIPIAATSPALVIVGLFMISSLKLVDWKNYETAIPAFIAMIVIPLTFSITHGIVLGFITYIIMMSLLGKARRISPALWIIGGFSLLSLVLTMV